jgi:hypothetical protein
LAADSETTMTRSPNDHAVVVTIDAVECVGRAGEPLVDVIAASGIAARTN